jgi:hypothetical protein
MPRPLYPWEGPGTHCIGGWVGPRAGLDGCRKSRPPTGIRSPDCPACSESLYWLQSCNKRILKRRWPYTYDLIDSWLTVTECANGRQTLIFRKCSGVNWGFVSGHPFPAINIPVCQDNIWKYANTVYAFTSIWLFQTIVMITIKRKKDAV